ncbi:putative ribonuclease H-like domain-containing protein [Tanacetum coccineum]|uniref:Ribonuclease H-like domain-containing protein n=1 Tax=Tanacetum coccineum TaxID=301880 RepID=A0ABQ5ATH0_9ASTR
MFDAIETRFGGNATTKKTQKTLLKQQYENFSASSVESLDSIFNKLQKIVSRLAILGVIIAQEVLKSKILSSLPPEWNTHVVVWMNKPEVETMSIDNLYNNFKIVKQKVKKSVGTSTGAQNLAFMTAPSTSSTNDANTASPQVSAASTNVNAASTNVNAASPQDLEQIHEDDLEEMDLKWQLSLLSVRAKKYYQRTGKKIFINTNDTTRYDKSKVECYNCHKLRHFARECRAPRSKEGFDWSDMAEEQVQTNMALMAFLDSKVYTDKTCFKTCLKNYETLKKQCDDLIVKLNQTEFIAATYKRGLAIVKAQLITYRKNEGLFSEEVAYLKREVACKDYEINVLKLLGSQITDKSKKGLRYSAVPPPHPLIYNRPKKLDLSYSSLDEFKEPEFKGYGLKNSKQESNVINCDNHQRRGIVSRNNYNRVDAKTTHPSVLRNMSPKAVLLKTGLTPLNTVRPVNTAHPKTAVHSAKSKTHFFKQAQSTAKRPFYKQTALTRRSVHASKRHYYTGRPKAVNTARSYTGQVNVVRVKGVNVVKSSACWVWRPTKPNGASLAFKRHNYIDARGRSKSNQTHLGISKEVGTPRYLSLVVPVIKVGNEAVHKELGDSMERAATAASS